MKKHPFIIGALALIAISASIFYYIREEGPGTELLPVTEGKIVKVYYGNSELDPELSCDKVFPVERMVSKFANSERVALQELLKGPTEEEKKRGFFTSINPGVRVKDLDWGKNIAYADFSEELNKDVAGSCRVTAIRAEITETLKQFPDIQDVTISVEGESEEILQP